MSSAGANLPKVSVVGGGLAGMVAALRLLQRGLNVTIFEAGDRLGGKAGAKKSGPDWDEHGYHIFPAWYLNIWALVDELGIRGHFLPVSDFWQLRAGEFPRYKVLKNLSSPWYAWENIRSGVLPPPEMFLFFYSILDLISRPYRRRAFLDRISVNAFVRSRFYRTERLARQHQDLLLKGISVPSYEVSAMTMRNVMKYWLRYPTPMHSILSNSLQELWIEPIEDRLRQLGCVIRLGHRLERVEMSAGRVSRLQLSTASGQLGQEVDQLVLAIPAERVCRLVDDEVYAAAPKLGDISKIRSRPMAALNLYFENWLENIPRERVNLIDSQFGLSFIDVSQVWPGFGGTVLNLIASDFTALANLSPEAMQRALLSDLRRFLPTIGSARLLRSDLQTHLEQPLFMNDIGAWQFRAEARSGSPNLYLAGDYCRSHVDLVSMEGAVVTGLLAAEALRQDLRLAEPVTIRVPQPHLRFFMVLLRMLLLPLAALAKFMLFLGSRHES